MALDRGPGGLAQYFKMIRRLGQLIAFAVCNAKRERYAGEDLSELAFDRSRNHSRYQNPIFKIPLAGSWPRPCMSL